MPRRSFIKSLFKKALWVTLFLSHYTVFSASSTSVQTECKISFINHFYLRAKNFLTKGTKFIQWNVDSLSDVTVTYLGRMLEVREDTILVESIDHNGQLEIVEISGKALRSIQTSDLAETRFKLFKNKGLKTVDAVNTPKMNVEEQLQRQEYENKYTAGADSVSYHAQSGKELKGPGVNPLYTYVKDFGRQAPLHIQHIREVIILQNKQLKQRLAALDILEAEAILKVQSESVNYNWWISLNERLSILVKPSSNKIDPNSFAEQNYELSTHAKHVLRLFPHVIVLPTIHRQGIFASNRFTFQGIVPITLFDTLLSTQSFSSGLIHITTGYGSKPQRPEIIAFHNHFIKEVIKLNQQERIAVETAYFLLTRENREYDNLQLSDFTNIEKAKTRMTINGRFMLRLTNSEDIGSLLSLVSLYGNRLTELEPKYEDAQLEVDYMSKLFSDFATAIVKKHQIQENN